MCLCVCEREEGGRGRGDNASSMSKILIYVLCQEWAHCFLWVKLSQDKSSQGMYFFDAVYMALSNEWNVYIFFENLWKY